MPIVTSDNPSPFAQDTGVMEPGPPPVLKNHPTQSAIAIDGWMSVLLGSPFLLAGIGIACAALNLVKGRKTAPDWLIGLIGGFFFLAGAFLIVHGLRGVARNSARQRAAADRLDEPWLSDHYWRREGIAFSTFKAMLLRLLAALVWYAFLIPFFWIGATQPDAGHIFLIFASLFALLGLFFWWRWLQMLGDLLRYGNSFLAYNNFPYFLGQPLLARLRAPRHISALDKLTLTLRCVEEKYVTTGSGRRRSTSVVCFELYRDVVIFSRDQLTGLAGGDIPIKFLLPEDRQVTSLASTPPIYWEIQAQGVARGADYEAYFLVPVYRHS